MTGDADHHAHHEIARGLIPALVAPPSPRMRRAGGTPRPTIHLKLNMKITRQTIEDFFTDTMHFDDTEVSSAERCEIRDAAIRGLHAAPQTGTAAVLDLIERELRGLSKQVEPESEEAVIQETARYTLRRIRRLIKKLPAST